MISLILIQNQNWFMIQFQKIVCLQKINNINIKILFTKIFSVILFILKLYVKCNHMYFFDLCKKLKFIIKYVILYVIMFYFYLSTSTKLNIWYKYSFFINRSLKIGHIVDILLNVFIIIIYKYPTIQMEKFGF